jgi:heavy metal sensor kinase
MTKLSIGLRLTLWFLAIFAAVQLCFGAGMWLVLRQHLYSIANNSLTAQVEDLTNLLKEQKPKNRNVPKLQEEVSEAYVGEHSGDFLQVYDQDGNWIYRSSRLEQYRFAPIAPAAVKGRSFQNVELANRPFRFITEKVEVFGRSYTVQTGIPIDQTVALLSLFRRSLLIVAPLLMLSAALGGYWLSRRALSPVDVLTRTARDISGSNLSKRLEKLDTGDELQRLSDTLNEMLARIENSFRRVSQFTADASHELRTPISLIRTEAEIALRKSRGSETYREALRHILLESERTSLLVEELLALARADSGSENLHLASVDLHPVITESARDWHERVEARGLQFVQTIGDGELLVNADCAALKRLLSILLDNATKYTPSPGTIELRSETSIDKAIIVVSDTGIGIAEQDQAKIFERFYRVDKARSRELGGAGIGLAIADWIVRQHRGAIKVRSSIGQGTTFSVELPLQPVASDSPQKEKSYAANCA